MQADCETGGLEGAPRRAQEILTDLRLGVSHEKDFCVEVEVMHESVAPRFAYTRDSPPFHARGFVSCTYKLEEHVSQRMMGLGFGLQTGLHR